MCIWTKFCLKSSLYNNFSTKWALKWSRSHLDISCFFFCLRLKWQICESVSDSALILDGFQNEKEEETLTRMTKKRNGFGRLISLPLIVTVASVRLGCLLRCWTIMQLVLLLLPLAVAFRASPQPITCLLSTLSSSSLSPTNSMLSFTMSINFPFLAFSVSTL